MTVKKLIAVLKKLPANAIVVVHDVGPDRVTMEITGAECSVEREMAVALYGEEAEES